MCDHEILFDKKHGPVGIRTRGPRLTCCKGQIKAHPSLQGRCSTRLSYRPTPNRRRTTLALRQFVFLVLTSATRYLRYLNLSASAGKSRLYLKAFWTRVVASTGLHAIPLHHRGRFIFIINYRFLFTL